MTELPPFPLLEDNQWLQDPPQWVMSGSAVVCEKWVVEWPENTTLGDASAADDGERDEISKPEKLPDLFTGLGIQTKWQQFVD